MKTKTLIGVVSALSSISIVLPQTDIPDVYVTIIDDNAIPVAYPGNIVETTSIE
ncbi:MAG: hypothetical protein LBV72_07305 [Tannerella sp.]|jgi:hypothetical protein|nr:hypothetical protein [Tannerella sp.]